MTRANIAALAVLSWAAAADAETIPYGEAKPWTPPAFRQAQATEPAPGVLIPPDADWSKAGPAEALTQTGRPPEPKDGTAGGAGGEADEDNGTNPAQNTRTVMVTNECYNLDGGNRINTTFLRFKFPMLERRGALIVEIPINYYNLDNPVSAQVAGFGDIKFQLNYNAWISDDKKTTFVTMLEMFIPSADNILLTRIANPNQFIAQSIGTGKYILGPGIGFVYAIEKNFIVAPLYFYEVSVAGIDAQPDISRGKLRVFLMYAWPSGLYVLPEFQVVTDFLNSNNDVYFGWEVGYSTKGSTFYIKPGIGICPNPGDREWGIEFGLRVQF
jgi:hypothetical protein